MTANPIEMIVMNRSGCWTVACNALDASGFGPSKEEAFAAFRKAIVSSINGQIDLASRRVLSMPTESQVMRIRLGASVAEAK
jgi:hypothetical protein